VTTTTLYAEKMPRWEEYFKQMLYREHYTQSSVDGDTSDRQRDNDTNVI